MDAATRAARTSLLKMKILGSKVAQIIDAMRCHPKHPSDVLMSLAGDFAFSSCLSRRMREFP